MREFLFLALRIYPAWAIPLAFIAFEVGIFFRRKKSIVQYFCWFSVVFLGVSTLLWLIFRGDLNSDYWVKHFLGDYGF